MGGMKLFAGTYATERDNLAEDSDSFLLRDNEVLGSAIRRSVRSGPDADDDAGQTLWYRVLPSGESSVAIWDPAWADRAKGLESVLVVGRAQVAQSLGRSLQESTWAFRDFESIRSQNDILMDGLSSLGLVWTPTGDVRTPTNDEINGQVYSALRSWLNSPLPGVLTLVAGEPDRAQKVFDSAIPGALADGQGGIVVPREGRAGVNEVLEEFGCTGQPVLPSQGSVVLLRHGNGRVSCVTRDSKSRSKNPHRLRRGIETAMRYMAEWAYEQVPEYSWLLTTDNSTPLPCLTPEPVTPEPVVQDLTPEIKRLRAKLDRAEATIRDLRKVNKALHRSASSATPSRDEKSPVEPVEVEEEPLPREVEQDEPAQNPIEGECFASLIDKARSEFPHLYLSPDLAQQAATLDQQRKARRWMERTWATLDHLNRYAAARRAGDDVSTFRSWVDKQDNPPVAPNHVRLRESSAVRGRSRFRRERTFKVPARVNKDERVFFEAHVRIEPGGSPPAPRLYFYDATAEAGVVCVGYLGPHLTNLMTN